MIMDVSENGTELRRQAVEMDRLGEKPAGKLAAVGDIHQASGPAPMIRTSGSRIFVSSWSARE